jgi:hypothetical protein
MDFVSEIVPEVAVTVKVIILPGGVLGGADICRSLVSISPPFLKSRLAGWKIPENAIPRPRRVRPTTPEKRGSLSTLIRADATHEAASDSTGCVIVEVAGTERVKSRCTAMPSWRGPPASPAVALSGVAVTTVEA